MSQAPVSPVNDAVTLAAEDRIRMSRLYEEVHTRLEEMAMITGRVLEMKTGGASQVHFRTLPSSVKGEFPAVEIVRTASGCGCYDYGRGACFECNGQARRSASLSKRDE
jgi:hypothetical protein